MKNFIILICSLLFGSLGFAQNPSGKAIVGIGLGPVFPEQAAFYVDAAENAWPNRLISPVAQVFGAYEVSTGFRIGAFLEYERGRYEKVFPMMTTESFNRLNLGFNWIGKVSKNTKLHGQLGGYVGFGMLTSPNWDLVSGVDVGMLAGPAYETDQYGAALHVQFGFAPYKGSGNPPEVLLVNPKLLFKVYYKLDWEADWLKAL